MTPCEPRAQRWHLSPRACFPRAPQGAIYIWSNASLEGVANFRLQNKTAGSPPLHLSQIEANGDTFGALKHSLFLTFCPACSEASRSAHTAEIRSTP